MKMAESQETGLDRIGWEAEIADVGHHARFFDVVLTEWGKDGFVPLRRCRVSILHSMGQVSFPPSTLPREAIESAEEVVRASLLMAKNAIESLTEREFVALRMVRMSVSSAALARMYSSPRLKSLGLTRKTASVGFSMDGKIASEVIALDDRNALDDEGE